MCTPLDCYVMGVYGNEGTGYVVIVFPLVQRTVMRWGYMVVGVQGMWL